MPLSTRSMFEVGHIGRVKGGSVSALPDLSTDFIEDDFDLNRSFPCTKRLMYTQNRGLEHFPWLWTGEWLIWKQLRFPNELINLIPYNRQADFKVFFIIIVQSVFLCPIMSFAMLMKDVQL